MSINDPLSPIRLQLMWDRLIAVVEEQALALMRTGFSTSTREAGDLSAGVFDLDGAMLAQAVTGTPGHINSMARAVYHFLAKFPVETMKEGDIFLTNDPWKGTGHLHDFTFVTPTFRRGKMVALFASTCHVVDIGGRGMGADARQVYEEGLYIPLMRFARDGKVDETLIDIVRRQRARAGPGRGRPLLAGDLQRDRLPPPDRDDGRVRDRRPRPPRQAHPREVASRLRSRRSARSSPASTSSR